MSKQEMYAWTSFLFSLALLGYYGLTALELPPGAVGYAGAMKGVFLKVIGLALLVELVLELSRYFTTRGTEEDERDRMIAFRGYRNAYFFVMVTLISLAGNVWLSDFLSREAGERVFLALPFVTAHALVVIILLAQIVKTSTQLYHYRVEG